MTATMEKNCSSSQINDRLSPKAEAGKNPILQVDHLVMRFGGLAAINDISCSIFHSNITAIIGPNGAGKTTFFNCLTGFYKPTEGMIRMHHEDGTVFFLERMDDFRISASTNLVRTFQNIRLFKGMTVLENLMVAQHNKLVRTFGSAISGLFCSSGYVAREREALDLAKYWLDRIGLIESANEPAGSLPYGSQRRLEIVRAMCAEPRLLCLDEPAAGLNPNETSQMNTLLRFIRDKHAVSIMLIEHDMSMVMKISDHVIVLDYGEKISDGTPEFVRNDPAVIAAYLGTEDLENIN
ncbi:MAG: ABC transporter ATP-binding protein [Alphaproteobacteria bacterium]|nr:ABC transporter ATP-binding protein [Alphaproteobacteria bacterium]